jgi:hypothetical protein
MLKWLDRSPRINRLINFLSNLLAKQQGLVPLVGIALATLGLILLLINVMATSRILEFAGLFLQGVGILLSLIGLLLSEPLGK